MLDSFCCSITGELMADPVLLVDSSHTYERRAIERWLRCRKTDPNTNLPVSGQLVPNHALKTSIGEYCDLGHKRQCRGRSVQAPPPSQPTPPASQPPQPAATTAAPPAAPAPAPAVDASNAPLSLTVLAALSAAERRQMIGERLYPAVASLQPQLAGKITGMLLEMDAVELLLLLDSDEALRSKVAEAVAVLIQHHAITEGAVAGAELSAASLAAASPEQQKLVIGERLFHAVAKLVLPQLVGKITGMLLEMDNAELLGLLGSDGALLAKVDEAVEVLFLHDALPQGFVAADARVPAASA